MASKTLIFSPGRCAWGKCLFCGYGRIQGKPLSKSDFDMFFGGLESGTDTVKLFGSGSFLDEKQVSPELREYFISLCRAKNIKKIVVESRPEFIAEKKLSEFGGFDYTISIGLEVADDRMLNKLNKGFSLGDFEKSAGTVHKCGGKLRAYLLVNPPFAKDIKKSLDKSVEYALKFSDSIVLINLLPHKDSPLFRMWVRGEWNFLDKEHFREAVKKWTSNAKIEVDEETFRFVPSFPRDMQKRMEGVGEEYLTHPYFDVWQDYLCRWYAPPEGKTPLFLPCSYTKPYSESKTHKKIISSLKDRQDYHKFHHVMISNPGVIPREFENRYPFNAYDWDEKKETEEIKKRYIEVTTDRIEKYLKAHAKHYDLGGGIYCVLKPRSESYKSLVEACSNLGLECTNLFDTIGF